MPVIRRQVNTAWEMTDRAAIKGQVLLIRRNYDRKMGFGMHPKRQGECKHRLMGMSELLKCCAASRGECAALRTWGLKASTGSRDAAASCICQSPPGLARMETKRSPALLGAEVLPLCMEQ